MKKETNLNSEQTISTPPHAQQQQTNKARFRFSGDLARQTSFQNMVPFFYEYGPKYHHKKKRSSEKIQLYQLPCENIRKRGEKT